MGWALITERSADNRAVRANAQLQRHGRELAIGGLPSIVPTVTMKVSEFVGGPHDGEVHDSPDPMPETLFAITFQDGSRYARVSERKAENSDDVIGLFRFDPTSTAGPPRADRNGLTSRYAVLRASEPPAASQRLRRRFSDGSSAPRRVGLTPLPRALVTSRGKSEGVVRGRFPSGVTVRISCK